MALRQRDLNCLASKCADADSRKWAEAGNPNSIFQTSEHVVSSYEMNHGEPAEARYLTGKWNKDASISSLAPPPPQIRQEHDLRTHVHFHQCQVVAERNLNSKKNYFSWYEGPHSFKELDSMDSYAFCGGLTVCRNYDYLIDHAADDQFFMPTVNVADSDIPRKIPHSIGPKLILPIETSFPFPRQDTNHAVRAARRDASIQSIRSLTLSNEERPAENAESLLRKMLSDYHEGRTDTPPDGGCFNSVVHAYACRGDAHKAEDILALMWREYEKGLPPPEKRLFTTVMYAWQRSEKKREAPDAAEQLLRTMHELQASGIDQCGPDNFSYTTVLHCWANSGRADSGRRAESLFRSMLRRFEEGDEKLQPDTVCFSNLINVFVNNNLYHEAERILWEMVDTFLAGLASASPTVRSFNTLLAAWAKSDVPEAPERVEYILRRWKYLKQLGKIQVSPDEYSYALLLKVWTKANRLDAIDKLMASFRWVKSLYLAGDEHACLDVIKHTTVIGALNKAGQVDRAYVLLGELINLYNESKDNKYKPDSRCFNTVLAAYSRAKGNALAGKKAESLLRRQWALDKSERRRSGLRPTQWVYSMVVLSYQNAGDPKNAERLLKESMELAKKGSIEGTIRIRTFKAVLQAWHTSQDPTKHIRIQSLRAEALALLRERI